MTDTRRVRDRVALPQVSAASERVAGELRGLAKQLTASPITKGQ